MAIKMVGKVWNPCLCTCKKSFVMDTVDDAVNLPECCVGSTAIAADGGMQYMVNASGQWVETGLVSSIDDYMEEALGGEY